VALLICRRDSLALLVAVLGAILGWAVGVLLAPYKPEETRFKAILKANHRLLDGYVVGKIVGVETQALVRGWNRVGCPNL
jgi:hypothetical protein